MPATFEPSTEHSPREQIACVAFVTPRPATPSRATRPGTSVHAFGSGLETLLLGGACSAVAFLVGRAVASFAEANMSEFFVAPVT